MSARDMAERVVTGSGVHPTVARAVIAVDEVDRESAASIVRQRGMHPFVAESRDEALEVCAASRVVLVVADATVMGPPETGCRAIRASGTDAPILWIGGTAPNELEIAMEHGADDFIARPCAPGNLEQRIQVLTRARNILRLGPATINVATAHLSGPDGQSVRLTRAELDLMLCLHRAHPDPVPSAELLRRAFNVHGSGSNIRFHVFNIRKKADDVGLDGETLIRSVRTVGYVLGNGQD